MDINKTIEWIKGGLFDPDPTWASYSGLRASWMDTTINLTLPLIIASAVIAYLLGLVFGSMYFFGRASLLGTIGSIIFGFLGVALWAFIASFFANMFAPDAGAMPPGDEQSTPSAGLANFDQAFAATSFAFIPGFIGQILQTVPFIGFLLGLGAFIYAVVLMYKSYPVFLGVQESDRAKHFIATLITGIVAMFILMSLAGALGLSAGVSALGMGGGTTDSKVEDWVREIEDNQGRLMDDAEELAEATDGGDGPDLFGVGRQTRYVEAAGNDRYEPPADGMLEREQVETFVRLMQATARMRSETSNRLKNLGENAEKEPSIGDLFSGIRGAMDLGTAEMQAVKSGGGNWAEHEWVKQVLFEARLHQDLNEASAHNWELYQEYAEDLNNLM